MTAILKVEELTKEFRKGKKVFTAVDKVSFEVGKGEVFGLVGESGCGKTTLGRSIIGLYEISGGKVYFEDELILSREGKKSVNAFNRKELRRDIQMIFQDPTSSLNPRMTVGEIVGEGLVLRGEKREAIEAKVRETLSLVGLSAEHMSRFPHEFSGGQRQRIGIARAVILSPKLIIADEPISALDVSIQAQVINLLSDLKRRLNLTFIFIAHDLSIVKYFSDKIAVMYQGKIVELTNSDELFLNPLHPYTKSLLSAIPIPDPRAERERKRREYVPTNEQNERLIEIKEGHFVLCGERVGRELKEGYGLLN